MVAMVSGVLAPRLTLAGSRVEGYLEDRLPRDEGVTLISL